MFAARGSRDEKDARGALGILVLCLRGFNRGTCGQPVDGDVVVGIGKPGPRSASARAFAMMAVGVPSGCGDGVKRRGERLERRVLELAAKSRCEAGLIQLDIRRALSRLRSRVGGFGRVSGLLSERREFLVRRAFNVSRPRRVSERLPHHMSSGCDWCAGGGR